MFFKVGLRIPNRDLRSVYFCVAKDQKTAEQFVADRFVVTRAESFEEINPDQLIQKYEASNQLVMSHLSKANETYNSLNKSVLNLFNIKANLTKDLMIYYVFFMSNGKRKCVVLAARNKAHAQQLVEETGIDCSDIKVKRIDPNGKIVFLNMQLKRTKDHADFLKKKADRYRDLIREMNKLKDGAKNIKVEECS